jgi:hypothetical protein
MHQRKRAGGDDRSPEKGYLLCQAKEGRVTREFVEIRPA